MNRINNIFFNLYNKFKEMLLEFKNGEKMWKVVHHFGNNKKLIEIAKDFNLSTERIRQIIAKTKRGLEKFIWNERFNSIENIIKNELKFDKRWIKINDEAKVIIKYRKIPNFKLIENILVDKKYLNYFISKIKKMPILIFNTLIMDLKNVNLFFKKFVSQKTFIFKDYIFYDKTMFLKWYVKKNEIINVQEDLKSLLLATKSKSQRSLIGLLERCDYLLKISQTKFIKKSKNLIRIYKIHLRNQIHRIVYKENQNRFCNIKKILEKMSKYTKYFPEDSLYYVIKKIDGHNYGFDNGNRKIIYPKNVQIKSLTEVLEKLYPKGYGVVDFDKVYQYGFSKTININTKLIWGKIYLSKSNQEKIIKDISSIVNLYGPIVYKVNALKHCNNILKFYLKNAQTYVKLVKLSQNCVVINNTFIKLQNKYCDEDRQKIINFLSNVFMERMTNFQLENYDKKKNSQMNTLLKFDPSIYNEVLKNIYSNRKITPQKRQIIRDYLNQK